MFKECLKQLFTPCSFKLRRMGYLSELIAIEARYKRQSLYWESHLRNSKFFILKEANKSKEKNHITIIGAGHLLDIPIEELAKNFKEVTLVDILILPKLRRRLKAYSNIKFVELDVSGVVEQSYKCKNKNALPTPQIPSLVPSDVIVSVNLLSQLPLLPMEFLGTEDEAWGKMIIESHLEFLKANAKLALLLCETNQVYYDAHHQLIEDNDMMFGVKLPNPQDEWIWPIAPLNEASSEYSIEGRVKAFVIQS